MPIPPYYVFHQVLLERELQSSDDATRILELPNENYMHALFIKVECTNGATSARNLDMADVLDAVTVYGSASDVLFSLIPAEMKRWWIWKTGHNIPYVATDFGGAVQNAVYPILFGRGMFDPEYYLPMKRLADPKLHLRFSPTIAATAFATGTTRFSVWALMSMDREPGQYRGTLSTKTIKSFTSAASGVDETLITRGNPIRQLMVYAYEVGVDPSANISRVKLSLNNDQRILYDHLFQQLQEWNFLDTWLNLREHRLALAADTENVDVKSSDIINAAMFPRYAGDRTGDTVYHRNINAVISDRLVITADAGDWTGTAFDVIADSTARQFDVVTEHNRLPNAVVLDFSKAGEGNLLNTNDYGRISLQLTQGNAGADVRVSTEEVRQL